MKELFNNEGFLVVVALVVFLVVVFTAFIYSVYKDNELKILAIEHQCEKLYDANGYYYGNCKK